MDVESTITIKVQADTTGATQVSDSLKNVASQSDAPKQPQRLVQGSHVPCPPDRVVPLHG